MYRSKDYNILLAKYRITVLSFKASFTLISVKGCEFCHENNNKQKELVDLAGRKGEKHTNFSK